MLALAGEGEDESMADPQDGTETDPKEESETGSDDDESQASHSRINFMVDVVESEEDEGPDETMLPGSPHTDMKFFADVPEIEEPENREAQQIYPTDFSRFNISDDEDTVSTDATRGSSDKGGGSDSSRFRRTMHRINLLFGDSPPVRIGELEHAATQQTSSIPRPSWGLEIEGSDINPSEDEDEDIYSRIS
ncbi:hypothetical protein IL306_014537 [Fusarium sp. DS 682]|nr:hypothetical protein IL306_014537 [Fusarium sp. DS 682]